MQIPGPTQPRSSLPPTLRRRSMLSPDEQTHSSRSGTGGCVGPGKPGSARIRALQLGGSAPAGDLDGRRVVV